MDAANYLKSQRNNYYRQWEVMPYHYRPSFEECVFQTLIDDPVWAIRDAADHGVNIRFPKWYDAWFNRTIGTGREQRLQISRELQFEADACEQRLCRKLSHMICNAK